MVCGVLVNDEGQCSSVRLVKNKTGGVRYNNKKMYIHYSNEDENLMILSSHVVENVLNDDVDLLTFSFPPPLNKYIYPKPVIVLRGSLEFPQDLTCESFVNHCAQFKLSINEIAANLTVYDVPLDEATFEEVDDSENEEDDLYQESDDEKEEEPEDDEDWEVDDDEGAVS